ncbi:MAG TPA: 3-dehydroquinate synthase [Candidatus Sulfotelmatobacter sp.]|nr:3-dehydroquinate synthase [Candidatus Sulfotelmatobacter sp.]
MEKIVLTGFMGTGKTAVGRCLARRLDLPFYDLDAIIEARAGRPITQIFREEGEPVFRAFEAEAAAATRPLRDCVLATGGGAILRAENVSAFREGGVVVGLTASPEAILARVGEGDARPLLAGGDPRARVAALLAAREPAYARADLRVNTTDLDPEAVAARIADWLAERHRGGAAAGGSGEVEVSLPGGAYRIQVGPGLLGRTGERLAALNLGPRAAVVTDEGVPSAHVGAVLDGLRSAGLTAETIAVPAGEESKSLQQVSGLYERFVGAGLDRGSVVLALGGGVVGDLAGYAAATFLRGLPLVHLPTTLLAQVDSSVGGKVGVNLPRGKNLVGAFHQPRLVLADVAALATLPLREFRSGLAEVVKYGVIADPGLFELLDREADRLAPGAADLLAPIVTRCCRVKAHVVALDERERGWRAILNFGHTVGHAVEAAAGYGALTHGEAVAIGMAAAARLSRARGLCPRADLDRLLRLLDRLGLPQRSPVPAERVLPYLAVDKKGRGGVPRFVLTRGIADVTLAPIHEEGDVRKALETTA